MLKYSHLSLIKLKGLSLKINTNKSYILVLKQYSLNLMKAFINMDYIYNINHP